MKTKNLALGFIAFVVFISLTGCASTKNNENLIYTPTSDGNNLSVNEQIPTTEPTENPQNAEYDIASLLASISPDSPFTMPATPVTAENINQVIPLAIRNMDDLDFTYLRITPHADMMAVTTPNKIKVYQLSTLELLTSIDYARVQSLAGGGTLFPATFSLDGKLLALFYGNSDGSTLFQVLDTETWTPVELGGMSGIKRINNPGGENRDSLVFLGDNQYILFSGMSGIIADRYSPDPKYALISFDDTLSSLVSISYDGTLIAGVGSDRMTLSVKKAEPLPSEVVFNYTFPRFVQRVAFSPTNHFLAASSYGELKVWNIDTGEIVFQYTSPFGDFDYKSVSFSSDGSLLFVDNIVFDLMTGNELYPPVFEYLWSNGLFYVGTNQEGTILVTTQYGQIIYWGVP